MELTDLEILRQLRFYLRLSYPVCITATARGYAGRFPDLPGCSCRSSDLRLLHEQLETTRVNWIKRSIMSGSAIPMPNSHTGIATPRRRPRKLRLQARATRTESSHSDSTA